jgi:hypothetical protein
MDPPEILYHYTDAKGLLGILNSNQIWATSYRYMNDAREFEYGFDLISELFQQGSPDSVYANLIIGFKWAYELDCIFVAAFSAFGDSLGQWRGYAGMHSGYSLGFRSGDLHPIDRETLLVECCYDKKEQLDKVRGLIHAFLPGMKYVDAQKDALPLLDIGYQAAEAMAKRSATLKHPKFNEEQEWRLIVGPLARDSERIRYRAGERVIIPYVEIDFPSGLPLDHIIVGPGPHQERNAGSLLQMLALKGYKDVKVYLSEIPFRPW